MFGLDQCHYPVFSLNLTLDYGKISDNHSEFLVKIKGVGMRSAFQMYCFQMDANTHFFANSQMKI